MKVGGSLANTAGSGANSASGRLDVGGGVNAANRKEVERLRQTDAELRAKLRKEANATFGAPRFIDTRGPDLGLYTVDGMVLGGVTSRAHKMAEETRPQPPQTNEAQAQSVPVPEGVEGAPAEAPVAPAQPKRPAPQPVAKAPKAVAAYAPPAAHAQRTAQVGVAKDLKV